MEDYESPADFWESYGVSYQMLHEKTQKLRNILNDRLSDQTLLTEEEGDYIVKWFNDYMYEKSKTFNKNSSHLNELFPDKSEIIKMLDDNGIGVKQEEEEEEKKIKLSEINPFLGGKRRKKKRRRRSTKKRRKRRRTKKKKRRKRRRTKKRRRN